MEVTHKVVHSSEITITLDLAEAKAISEDFRRVWESLSSSCVKSASRLDDLIDEAIASVEDLLS